jgi:hypothetical protein
MISTVRTRSVVADAKPTRQSKPREIYTAKPSTPIKGGPKHHHWHQQKKNLLHAISNLESLQQKYQKTLYEHWSSSIIQNDCPLEMPIPIYPPCLDFAIESLKQNIKEFVQLNPLHEVTSILRSIGFESSSI